MIIIESVVGVFMSASVAKDIHQENKREVSESVAETKVTRILSGESSCVVLSPWIKNEQGITNQDRNQDSGILCIDAQDSKTDLSEFHCWLESGRHSPGSFKNLHSLYFNLLLMTI